MGTAINFYVRLTILWSIPDGGDSEDELKEDIDIGHYSYIHACEQLENPPIRKIFEQLQTTEIRLQYVGLNNNDIIALSYALLVIFDVYLFIRSSPRCSCKR